MASVQFQSEALATPPADTAVAVDDVGGEAYQKVKLDIGAAGASSPVTADNPMPVAGIVAVSNLPATQPVSGTVNIGNIPATQPVSGTVAISNLPATQPVSGPLTAAELAALTVYTRIAPTSTDKDAFGRLRVSLPQVLGFGQFEYGLNAQFHESQTSGTGTVTSTVAQSAVSLRTGGTTTGALARAQTRTFFRYVPGRSQLARMTGVFATPTGGVRQRAGYFSGKDGLFLEWDGPDLYLVRRTSTSGVVVDNRIPRSSWYDKFDGTGPSGINLAIATGTSWLMWFDLEWLGVGRYRFGFASPMTGELLVAHAAAGTNVLAVPYIRTACLPARYEIENTATGADLTMKWFCYSVDSEGGDEGEIPLQYPIDNDVTQQSLANGTFKPILALRANTTGPNSVENRGQIILKAVQAAITGSNTGVFRLILNPTTLTQNGGAITWNSVGNLGQYARFSAAGDTVAGGLSVGESFYVSASAQNKGTTDVSLFRKFPLVYTELGSVQDTLVLVGAGIGGTSAAVGAISFQELF